jgi:DNA-binding response OmpR family regulator
MSEEAVGLPARVHVGDVGIDLIGRRVTVRDRRVELSPVDLSLLYVLATRRGEVVSRETILRMVWGEDNHSNIIERHIASLRALICPDPAHPRYIQTVVGQGYRFR